VQDQATCTGLDYRTYLEEFESDRIHLRTNRFGSLNNNAPASDVILPRSNSNCNFYRRRDDNEIL
jgi:hypothetical protein